MLHVHHLIILDFIVLIFAEAYKLRSSSLYGLLQPPPEVQTFSSAPCSQASSSYVLPFV